MKQLLKKTYYVPKPHETCVKGTIKWGGNNLYPQWLNWMYYTSGIHAGIINGKVFFTVSGGLVAEGSDELKKLAKMFEAMAPDLSRENEIGNSFFIKCKMDILRTRINSFERIPYEQVRRTETDGEFRISENWAARTTEFKTLRTYEKVKNSPDKTEIEFIYEHKRGAMQFQIDGAGSTLSKNYYPIVPYSGAINSILTDIEISKYQLSEVVNNFSLGTILSLNNGKPKEQKDEDKIINRISDNTTGSTNAGGTMVLFSNGKETEPTVLHLNGNQLNERYLSLGKDVRVNILQGHSAVSGELFGFPSEGSFNASNIEWSYFIMKNNYFKQRQKELVDFLEFVMKVNNLTGTIGFNDVELPTQETQVTATNFKKDEPKKEDQTQKFLDAFQNVGREKDGVKVLMTEELNLENPFSGILNKKEDFATTSAVELQVLGMMLNGESFEAISKALDIKPSDLAKIYQRLRRGGHVNENGQITDKGKNESIRSQVAQIEILYSYEKKPEAPPLVAGGKSRPFCAEMLRLNRFYTRQEIDQISNDLDSNVWMFRGGWYTVPKGQPNAGTHQPSCRHYWQQHITFKNS